MITELNFSICISYHVLYNIILIIDGRTGGWMDVKMYVRGNRMNWLEIKQIGNDLYSVK